MTKPIIKVRRNIGFLNKEARELFTSLEGIKSNIISVSQELRDCGDKDYQLIPTKEGNFIYSEIKNP